MKIISHYIFMVVSVQKHSEDRSSYTVTVKHSEPHSSCIVTVKKHSENDSNQIVTVKII